MTFFSAAFNRLDKGRAGVERERLISAEEGLLFSSGGYFIMGRDVEGQGVIRGAKQRFRKVKGVPAKKQIEQFNRHFFIFRTHILKSMMGSKKPLH